MSDPDAITVRDGQIIATVDGITGPITPSKAWNEWLRMFDSPFPAVRDRSARFREALNEIRYLQ